MFWLVNSQNDVHVHKIILSEVRVLGLLSRIFFYKKYSVSPVVTKRLHNAKCMRAIPHSLDHLHLPGIIEQFTVKLKPEKLNRYIVLFATNLRHCPI